MYELDGRVLLYLAHYECSSFGRGLRCGVTITISNVCVLNVKDPTFKVHTISKVTRFPITPLYNSQLAVSQG